jgi:hypothetical protein
VLEEIAKDKSLAVGARGFYLLAWAHDPATVSELARQANANRGTAARACRQLVERGWMKMVGRGQRKRPAAIIPYQCQVIMAHDMEEEYELVTNRGEFLINRRLDLSLRGDEYVLNARPKFLTNPATGRQLEYDRFDPKAKFASEHNGLQHYRGSEMFSEEQVNQQKTHDLIKESLSARNGVTLLTFTWRDLRPGALEARIDEAIPRLKRGFVDLSGTYAKTLNRICDAYATKAERAEKESGARENSQ